MNVAVAKAEHRRFPRLWKTLLRNEDKFSKVKQSDMELNSSFLLEPFYLLRMKTVGRS